MLRSARVRRGGLRRALVPEPLLDDPYELERAAELADCSPPPPCCSWNACRRWNARVFVLREAFGFPDIANAVGRSEAGVAARVRACRYMDEAAALSRPTEGARRAVG
ncbi:hypothetical protein ACU686_33445 [Yinghuangia aomiensis]